MRAFATGGSGSRFWIADRKLGSVAQPQIEDFVTGCYTLGEARRYLRDHAIADRNGYGYRIFDWKANHWQE